MHTQIHSETHEKQNPHRKSKNKEWRKTARAQEEGGEQAVGRGVTMTHTDPHSTTPINEVSKLVILLMAGCSLRDYGDVDRRGRGESRHEAATTTKNKPNSNKKQTKE